MGSFSEALADATQKTLCSVINSFQSATEIFSRIPGDAPARSAYNYWRSMNRRLCDEPVDGPPPPPEEGQCDGVLYYLEFSLDKSTNNSTCARQTVQVGAQGYGPIKSYRLQQKFNQFGAESYDILVTWRGGNASNPVQERLFGNVTNSGSGSCPPIQILDVSIERPDGQPDDCGEPVLPGPPPPGWNVVNNYNFTWNDNSNNTVNEFGDFTFGFAYVDVDNDLKIPVKVDVGGISFNGTFNVDLGGFSFDFGDDITNNYNGDNPDFRPPRGDDRILPPTLPGNPSNPGDVPDDPGLIDDRDDPDEDVRNESRIVAVRIVTTQVNNKAIGEVIQTYNPNIKIPDLGLVQFLVQTDETAGAWTEDIPVKSLNAFIPCPWPDGALDVRATPRQGVFWSIQALRKRDARRISFPA